MSSRAHVRSDEWLAPEAGDAQGLVPAGKLLEWLEAAGAIAAARHCRRAVVIESVDAVALAPVRAGERVRVLAQVVHTAHHSVGVNVGIERAGLEAQMSFVPLDRRGRPVLVPRFWPQAPADRARFREEGERREARQRLCALVERTPRRLRRPWEDASSPLCESVSYLHRVEAVRPAALNCQGTLAGATLLGWCEELARRSAELHAGAPMRCIGLTDAALKRPVERDRFVHLHALAVHTSGAAVTCLVGVQSEDPAEGTTVENLRGFFVCRPADGVARVPPLEARTAEQRALADEVEQRLAIARSLRLAA